MKSNQRGNAGRILVFFGVLVLGFLFFSFFIGRKPPVKPGELGVVKTLSGDYKVLKEGERPFIIPLLQSYGTLSSGTEVLSFVGEEGFLLPGDGKERLESQITYSVEDPQKVAQKYGLKDTAGKIRNEIKMKLNDILAKNLKEKPDLSKPSVRIPLIAEVHLSINEAMKESGINILKYDIRFE
ncbi:MAG: hypothetical protein D6726_06615 [Nitrospirae bacterium]|nr:MAG: hypothetical protein D6726_06615 [Nitrospirota bacterium]